MAAHKVRYDTGSQNKFARRGVLVFDWLRTTQIGLLLFIPGVKVSRLVSSGLIIPE